MMEQAQGAMSAEDRLARSRDMFLSSHRALAACNREFARLAEEVTVRTGVMLREAGIDDKPEMRMSPGRCIIQAGPVALTISWLRATLDSVSDGKLLVVAWHGRIATGSKRLPEGGDSMQPTATAKVLWEDTLSAEASKEDDWQWRSEGDPKKSYTSDELAARCMVPLKATLENKPVEAAAPAPRRVKGKVA
ncbi:MAG: hypothetical protein JWO05_3794 [Gemmatimonadetes bacterium]|nr:hypothetical protein [Gemmatimonadota bacterium]